MTIQKLLRQYGEHGNDYSVLEIGDVVNEIIDVLREKGTIDTVFSVDEKVLTATGKQVEEFESLRQAKEESTAKSGDSAVRSPSSADRVYLVREGKKSWIKNPETLFKLGFNFHNVKNITNEEMDSYELGEDMDLKEYEGSLVEKPKEGEVDKYGI